MGSFAVELSVDLDQDPEVVWRYVTTEDGWRRPFVREVTSVSAAPVAVGNRYENVLAIGPMRYTATNEITAVEPPHRLTWAQTNETPVTTVEGNYLISARDGGSRFTLANRYETRGLTAPPAPIARWVTERIMAPRLFSQLRAGLDAADEHPA